MLLLADGIDVLERIENVEESASEHVGMLEIEVDIDATDRRRSASPFGLWQPIWVEHVVAPFAGGPSLSWFWWLLNSKP